ncbi:MAG: hypothetical protein KIS69_10175 [Bacteroidetes bacterium]|nr:hypothetical protein [Bacteroidota bacterium]
MKKMENQMNYDEMDSLIETLEKRVIILEKSMDAIMKAIGLNMSILEIIAIKINKLENRKEEKAND